MVHLNFNPALALITFQEPDPDKVLKKNLYHTCICTGRKRFFFLRLNNPCLSKYQSKLQRSVFLKSATYAFLS